MKFRGLKVNHLVNPLGYDLRRPVFSFKVEESTGKYLKWGRIRVSDRENMSNIIYDSGKVENINPLEFSPDYNFPMGKRYYWQVSGKADDGDEGVSRIEWFEGGLSDNDLGRYWITSELNNELPNMYKEFRLDGSKDDIISARLYICGVGLYEAYINGKKAGDEYLTPFYNDYRYWLQYETYDVTESIGNGKNIIQILLGNGWYKGRFSYQYGGVENIYGNRCMAAAKLVISFKEGRSQIITTDDTWQYKKSPVAGGNIYDGEIYDACVDTDKEKGKSCKPVKEVNEYNAPVVERVSPPLKIQEKIINPNLIITPLGEQVLDFGQEVSGWVEFDCKEERGRKIKLQYGEILQNNNFYRDNLRTAKAEFVFICNGKRLHARPHFTFYGFRYVKVSGIKLTEENFGNYNFTACVIYSEMERTGYIKTSSIKVNKLIENTLWGQKGNFIDVPTDCPQRDERLGWTGDAQVFCRTASYHMDTAAFFRKYLKDMAYAQKEKGGAVPYVVPDVHTAARVKMGDKMPDISKDIWGEAGSCGWGDAATVIPWTMYLFYGDKAYLRESYENMKMWTDFIIDMDEKYCGGERLWTVGFHFADWLALDNSDKNSCFGMTDKYFVASVYYFYSSYLTYKAAEVLGFKDDERYYGDICKQVRAAIIKKYFTKEGNLICDTQTGLVLAVYFNLMPQGMENHTINRLKEKLISNNMHLDTGFIGTAYLCKALTKAGLNEEAYTLLLNEDYPGWLYEVNMGATTVWERWNSVLPDGSISDTGMNSLNHYAYGAIVEWIYETVCGIKPDETEAGFKKAVISPSFDKRIEKSECIFDSASGIYRIASELTGEKENIAKLQVEVPFNCKAEFIVPDGYVMLSINGNKESMKKIIMEKGKYEIVMKKSQKHIV